MYIELTMEELKTRGGPLDKFMNTVFDSVIIVDREGYVIHCGTGARQLTMLPPEEMIGRHITCFDSDSPFERVIKTGKAEINLVSIIQGHKCLQSIYPVISNCKVIGAVGIVMYSNLNSLSKLLLNVDANTRLSTANMQDVLARVETNYTFEDFLTENKAVKEMLRELKSAALTNHPILLIGETGTGKEILASAIHSQNLKKDFTPYVKINCAAIPNDLLESELFGYEKGAFTGASSSKKGKFEIAAGGSILLDEIGDMDMKLQSKLLRVLEEKEFERVGGVNTIPMRARVISSTNCNLRERCRQGKFREDLYFRLNTVEIRIPPLRERPEDIPLLVSFFVERAGVPIAISEGAMKAMKNYHWPGNVRELRNIINRLSITHAGKSVTAGDVKSLSSDQPNTFPAPAASSKNFDIDERRKLSLEENEKHHILQVLHTVGNNIAAAAKHLGVSRATLYRKINKYGIYINKTVFARNG